MSDAKLTDLRGVFAELYVSYKLLLNGFEVFKNLSCDGIDLIAKKDGKITTIQVKSSTKYMITKKHPGYCFQIKKKTDFSQYDCDFFIFVALKKLNLSASHSYIFPSKMFKNHKSSCLNITTINKKWIKFKDKWSLC